MSRTVDVGDDILLSFSTPVLARTFPDHKSVNRGLSKLILDRANLSDGIVRSNVGSWHSDSDFLQWDNEGVRPLVNFFCRSVKSLNDYAIGPELESGDMDASAWANVSHSGDYHQPHHHPESDWSGVYYVADGVGPDDEIGARAGRIEMLDPRSGVSMLNTPGHPFLGNLQFKPEAGLMLIFPSWLTHYVHPHGGSLARISVAFNAKIASVAPTEKKKRFLFG